MSYYVECDWCGEVLTGQDHAVLPVTIKRQRASRERAHWAEETRPTIHLCVGEEVDYDRLGMRDHIDDGESCFTRAMAAIHSIETAPPNLGMEWRLVPMQNEESTPTNGKHAPRGPVAEDLRAILATLAPKVRYALPRAGITTIAQVEAMTDGELEALPGVGLGTVRALRQAIGDPESGRQEEVA